MTVHESGAAGCLRSFAGTASAFAGFSVAAGAGVFGASGTLLAPPALGAAAGFGGSAGFGADAVVVGEVDVVTVHAHVTRLSARNPTESLVLLIIRSLSLCLRCLGSSRARGEPLLSPLPGETTIARVVRSESGIFFME